MAQAWSIFVLGAFCLVVVVAVVFAVQTSVGENVLQRLAKVVGMFVSIVPILGLIMYLAFKGRPSGFGEKCGTMAIIGVVWYVALQGGRQAFLAH